MTQTAQVLELLRVRGDLGLTSLEALQLVGSFRLAARIADLHAAGYAISAEMIALPNGKRVARYRLEAEPSVEPVQLRAW